MRFMSSIIASPKLFLSLCLIGSVTTGYTLLASYSLLFLNCGHSVILKSVILTALFASGLYFSFQTASTLFTTDSEPLSKKGAELYAQQRCSTLWVAGAIGWALLLSQYPLDAFYIYITSGLLGFAQLQLAQSLSSGRAFHLIVCKNEATRASNFSMLKFIDDNILIYASKKYLNAQIVTALVLGLFPLETLPELAYSQGFVTVASHFIFSWATAAQWLLALGFILPCLYYAWSNSAFFVKLRQCTNWLAPSFLSVIQLCALFSLSAKLFHKGSADITLANLESITLNAAALLVPFFLSSISKNLTDTTVEHNEENFFPVNSAACAVNLEESTELLF